MHIHTRTHTHTHTGAPTLTPLLKLTCPLVFCVVVRISLQNSRTHVCGCKTALLSNLTLTQHLVSRLTNTHLIAMTYILKLQKHDHCKMCTLVARHIHMNICISTQGTLVTGAQGQRSPTPLRPFVQCHSAAHQHSVKATEVQHSMTLVPSVDTPLVVLLSNLAHSRSF